MRLQARQQDASHGPWGQKSLARLQRRSGMRSVSPQALYIIQMDSVRLTKEGYALHEHYLTLLDRVSLTLAPHKIEQLA